MKQLYLDTDDDITSVINAVTAADQKKVALIPPKRSTTLQSVVNLKLLQKAAREANKEIVLITREPGILNLAARVKLLAAANLETEPMVPEVPQAEEQTPAATITAAAVGETDLSQADKAAALTPSTVKAAAKPEKIKKGGRVPDFDKFKKYGLLAILALSLLAVGLWYALTQAPRAVLTINGQTAEVQTEFSFQAESGAEKADLDKALLPAQRLEAGRTLTSVFKATGKETIGEKATGEVVVTNCESTTPITIEQGTALTAANGLVFRASESVGIPGSSAAAGFVCARDGQASVPVRADKIGGEYNIGPTSYSVAGYSAENVSGQGDNMSGGQKEQVTVISEADVTAAREALLKRENQAIKAELEQQFEVEEQFVIDASFNESVNAATPEPAVGGQAAEGRLILQVTYSLTAVNRPDIEALLKQQLLKAAEDNRGLGVVESGLSSATLSTAKLPNRFQLKTTGRLGPDIDQDALKAELAGVGYARAIETVESKPNVTKALVDLSPFWVSKVPSDPNKVEIKFEIDQDLDETDSRN